MAKATQSGFVGVGGVPVWVEAGQDLPEPPVAKPAPKAEPEKPAAKPKA